MQTVNDISFKQTRALVRVDFNVPLDDNLKISDTTRIDAALPTLKKILKDGGSLVIMSHLGRPKLEYQSVKLGAEKKFSLVHIVDYLKDALDTDVIFLDDCVSEEAFSITKNLKKGQVVLLENLRYYPEEKAGEIDFAQMLAQHGQVYVNDAFGTAHRAHASTAIIADSFIKANKCFGLLMAAEIENANRVLQSKEKPVTAILGGAKVSDKIKIIENLLPVADNIIIGGGMAYTFFKAQGFEIGNSLVEEDRIELAKEIIEKAKESNTQLLLPKDSVVADAFSNEANTAVANNEKIDEGWMGLDIGPDARDAFSETILSSKIILWNGPMGVFEMSKFQAGTKAIADAVADATNAGAFSLVGGGDSVAAVNKFAYNDKVSYVSTGGGAMLEYFEGKTLPGIAAILKED
ncbi:phosphoglycerate kinase [Chitinophagales bacterium]|nr:phosphoglycerate kinase [Chitinophagales bacterium]